MIRSKVPLQSLREVSILYEGDFCDLAQFVLRVDCERSERAGYTKRRTLHGIARLYASVLNCDVESVERVITANGLPLGATLEDDVNA